MNSVPSSHIYLSFDILHAATKNGYEDADDIRLVNLGPIALFSECKLASSSGKVIEDIYHAHIVCLMYKLITSSRGSDDYSVGLNRDRKIKQRELTTNKNIKRKYHIRIY